MPPDVHPAPGYQGGAAEGAEEELETKVKRKFAKVSIVSYSHPSLMIIALATQFHVYRVINNSWVFIDASESH